MQRPFQQSVFCVLFHPAMLRPLSFSRPGSVFHVHPPSFPHPGSAGSHARAPSFTFILRHSHARVPPVPTPGPRLSRSSSVFLTPDLCCIHARPVVSVSSIPLRRFHARSRSDPPALRSRSSRRSARVSRIVSRMVQRLSNSCASMRGCSSLTTRMMSFIAT